MYLLFFFLFPWMAIKSAAGATQRIWFSASRELWLLWKLVVGFHREFGTACFQICLGDLSAFSSPYASLTWLKMESRRVFREQLLSRKEAALCLCQVEWIASVFRGTEEFWTHSPMSHKKALGGGRGKRAVFGYSWYCFRNFICIELDITCGYLGVSQKHQNIWILVLI